MSGCHEEILTQGGLLKQRIRQAGVCVCVCILEQYRVNYMFFYESIGIICDRTLTEMYR